MMINPGGVIKTQLANVPAPLGLGISGSAFTLFFLQTGLDLVRTGRADWLRAAMLAGAGLVYGVVGISLLAILVWVLTRPFRGPQSLGWTIRAFGLAYSATLIYAILGAGFNVVLGWNTSMAFGVTGVLWALGPVNSVIQEMARGKLAVSLLLATICGGALLYGWAYLGNL